MARTDVLAALYAGFAADDREAMRSLVHDDVEIVERLEVPGARVYRGVEEWERGYDQEAETVADFGIEPLAIEEGGGRCVAEVVIRLRGRGSGAEVADRIGHLVEFDGEKVSRIRAFSDVEEARRVARALPADTAAG